MPRFYAILAAGVGAWLAGAGSLMVAAAFLQASLVAPVAASGLLLAAVTLGLAPWASPARVGWSRVVFWDTAGALTILGLAAAFIGEPEQAVALLERDR